jgi:two-component system alkaline phosphatase synthesis response regulator PhoP
MIGVSRVLIVEDDEAMSTALRDGFEYEGFSVTVARDGARGLRLALESTPDIIILDVMLPKLSGLDLCRRIRSEKSEVPVIMLTARGQEIDKVLGLKTGADDYITKPFSFMELMARVEAVLRRARSRASPSGAPCQFGDVEVDFRKCEASKGSRPIELSAREWRLLEYFAEHRGQVLSRDQLLTAVWGYHSDSFSRTVDMHVAKLRRKIEDQPDTPRHIVTVHGVGYKFTG